MYLFPEMIDMTNVKWKSTAHRAVAQALLIGNRRINSLNELMIHSKTLNKLSEAKIQKLTVCDAVRMGIPVN